jgi:hypothetical protein
MLTNYSTRVPGTSDAGRTLVGVEPHDWKKSGAR